MRQRARLMMAPTSNDLYECVTDEITGVTKCRQYACGHCSKRRNRTWRRWRRQKKVYTIWMTFWVYFLLHLGQLSSLATMWSRS